MAIWDFDNDLDDTDQDELLRDNGGTSPRRRQEKPPRGKRTRRDNEAAQPAGRPKKKGRLKAYWAVYSDSLKEVAVFDYGQQAEAQRRAEELAQKQQRPHFVRMIKRPIPTTGAKEDR